jgi:nitrogen fixation protein NifQ
MNSATGCAERRPRRALYTRLIDAAHPDSPDAPLFATLLVARASDDAPHAFDASLGLSPARLRALLARHFPRLPPDALDLPPATPHATPDAAFVATLRGLLMRDASPAVDRGDARCVASLIAHACLRPDHLWRDLGLDGREAVSALLTRYFPALAARNTAALRWKQFLAFEVATARGMPPAPAPGCPGCEDYAFCFPRDALRDAERAPLNAGP